MRIPGRAGPSFRLFLGEAAKLAELLFVPSRCRICGTLLARRGERVVCYSCLEGLKPCRSSFCPCCGRFFEGAGAPHLCLDCLKRRPPYSLHRSCASYQGRLREMIILMKYQGFRVLAHDLAYFALDALGSDESLWCGLEAIVPVPLHPRKKRRRGFNQAEMIARGIGRAKNLAVLGTVLRRVRNIPAQTALDGEARRRNVRGAFVLRHAERVEGRTLLVVDDVYTTGATIGECCRVLGRGGVKEVRALTLART